MPQYSQMSPLNNPQFFANSPEMRLQLLQQLQGSERGPSEDALMQLLQQRLPREAIQERAFAQPQAQPGVLRQLYDAMLSAYGATPAPMLERGAFAPSRAALQSGR